MTEQIDTLLSLAEVAVALAGFSAIVVVLKRGASGQWSASDADQFHGMIIHAIAAVVFCLLPMIVDVIVQDPAATLRLCCAVLGVQVILHAVGVMSFSTTGPWARLSLSVGLVIGFAQFAAFTDWAATREFALYVLGIVWHILQAGLLFVMLVWIPRRAIAPTPPETGPPAE